MSVRGGPSRLAGAAWGLGLAILAAVMGLLLPRTLRSRMEADRG